MWNSLWSVRQTSRKARGMRKRLWGIRQTGRKARSMRSSR